MRVLHIIPGIGCEEREPLRSEHFLALKSLVEAVSEAPASWQIMVSSPGSCPDWEIELPLHPHTNFVPELQKGFPNLIRPKLSNYLHKDLPQADLVVFTNADILVSPAFYQRVNEMLAAGHLAGSINRRTVEGVQVTDQDALTATVTAPKTNPHPGSDCFFFSGKLIQSLDFGEIVLGVPPVGRAILSFLAAAEPTCRIFPDEHVTFHIGDEKIWKSSRDLQALARRNTLAWLRLWPGLIEEFGMQRFAASLKVIGRGSLARTFRSVLRGLLHV